jgi:hypothetical protein
VEYDSSLEVNGQALGSLFLEDLHQLGQHRIPATINAPKELNRITWFQAGHSLG